MIHQHRKADSCVFTMTAKAVLPCSSGRKSALYHQTRLERILPLISHSLPSKKPRSYPIYMAVNVCHRMESLTTSQPLETELENRKPCPRRLIQHQHSAFRASGLLIAPCSIVRSLTGRTKKQQHFQPPPS